MATKKRKAVVSVELKESLLADIMCIALEGGIGYWCAASHIRRRKNESTDSPVGFDYVSFRAHDTEGDDFKNRPVNYNTIARGINKALKPGARIRSDLRDQIFRGVVSDDAGEIDADAADVIVQFGMFGRIVYG